MKISNKLAIILDIIIVLAYCFGIGILLAYSGIMKGMSWDQIICLILGCSFVFQLWKTEK